MDSLTFTFSIYRTRYFVQYEGSFVRTLLLVVMPNVRITFTKNSVPADSFESNRPESKRVPFSSLPTALFCKHPPEVHAGDIRIGTHRRMKGEVTNSNKAHVAQSNTARVIIEVCLEVIYPPGGFKPLACCVRRK